MAITAKTVKTLPNGTHRLERGVYLRVRDTQRIWMLRYMLNGRRRELSLGGVETSLDQVRAMAASLKAMIARGVDPLSERDKRKEEEAQRQEQERKESVLFRDFYEPALRFTAEHRKWAGKYYLSTRLSWMLRYAVPTIGDKPVYSITAQDVAEVLSPVWEKAFADDLRIALSFIFRRAVALELREDDPAEWKALERYLPSRAVMKKGKAEGHRAAVDATTLREVVKALIEKNSATALALVFGVLTVLRAREFCESKWTEISLEDKTLSVPPERRKDKKTSPFVVPLSAQAMRILEFMPRVCEYVFSVDSKQPVARCGLLYRIQSLCDQPITVHGTRSTFSDWCAKNDKNFLVSEKCLMHSVGGAVFMAYQRDDLLDKRRELLQEWADYICPMEWLEHLTPLEYQS